MNADMMKKLDLTDNDIMELKYTVQEAFDANGIDHLPDINDIDITDYIDCHCDIAMIFCTICNEPYCIRWNEGHDFDIYRSI